MDEHVMEAMGKARVVIRDGKVVEVGEPELEYCPIFEQFRGIKKLTKEEVRKNMQFRVDDFGMCRPDRKLHMRDYLSFGVSEMISTAISEGLLDAAVIVCEGCGTVVLAEPDLVQGVGGRVSGLVSTTPIPGLIERLGRDLVLDPETARIDQIAGVQKAIAMGYKRIAVSVATGSQAKACRALEKEHDDVALTIFVVHTSGLSEAEAQAVFDYADVATGCASKHIRGVGHCRHVYHVGNSVPIFGITPRGRQVIEARVRVTGKKVEHKPDAL